MQIGRNRYPIQKNVDSAAPSSPKDATSKLTEVSDKVKAVTTGNSSCLPISSQTITPAPNPRSIKSAAPKNLEEMKTKAIKSQKTEKNLRNHRSSNPAERFRVINQELKLQLTEELVSTLAQEMPALASAEVKKAKTQNKVISFEHRNVRFFATPKGEVYLNAGEVGRGNYKTTYKVAALTDRKMRNIKSSNAEWKALSLTKEGNQPAAADKAETANEILLQRGLRHKEKRIQKKQSQGESIQNVLSHVAIGRRITSRKSDQVALLSPFANGGDLNKLIQNNQTILNREDKLKVAKDIFTGVVQLHERDIIHRDLKLDNFLVELGPSGKINKVKVTDLGKATYTEGKGPEFKPQRVAVARQAPELFDGYYDVYDPSLKTSQDAYQLGIVLYQVFAGKLDSELSFNLGKFPRGDWDAFHDLRKNYGNWPDFGTIEPGIQEIITGLLNPDPNSRLPVKTALEMLNAL